MGIPFARPTVPRLLMVLIYWPATAAASANNGRRDGHRGGHRTAAAWRPGVARRSGSPVGCGAPHPHPQPYGLGRVRGPIASAPVMDSRPVRVPSPTAASGGRRPRTRGSSYGASSPPQ